MVLFLLFFGNPLYYQFKQLIFIIGKIKKEKNDMLLYVIKQKHINKYIKYKLKTIHLSL